MHTHPNDPYPSDKDIETAAEFGMYPYFTIYGNSIWTHSGDGRSKWMINWKRSVKKESVCD